MGQSDNERSSAGGSRTASGISFQDEVFAWWAALSATGDKIYLGIDEAAIVATVGAETGLGVDDVGAILSNGGFILVQSKGGMRRLASTASDLRDAVDQVVHRFKNGIPTVDPRPIDPDRDRLIIATDHNSSMSFNSLSKGCERLRGYPSELPLEDAGVNSQQRGALQTFLEIIRSSWTSTVGISPTDEELRSLLRVVEVMRHDFGEHGVDRGRADAMLNDATVPSPFERLAREGLLCARTRSWRSRSELRKIVGLPAEAISDRDRLEQLTDENLARLRDHEVLHTAEGDVHVPRAAVAELSLIEHGFLITGPPGSGKSAVIGEIAGADTNDKVVLTVDSLPDDRAVAQTVLGLTSDIASALADWHGDGRATLYLDGLDAHRGGMSWLPGLVENLQGTRWRVVATIRHFELVHSRRWRDQFQGPPIESASVTNSALRSTRHISIQGFAPNDLDTISAASASIAALLNAGGGTLRNLLSNPFNMSLAADLLRVTATERITTLRTQAQLLDLYWQVRVKEGTGSFTREEALHQLVSRMVTARSLEAGLQGLPIDIQNALEELVSSGVLDEASETQFFLPGRKLRFHHHIVFDFALAAFVLSQGDHGLASALEIDPDFVIFGRPAIDFYFDDLWSRDEDHKTFWRAAIKIAESGYSLAVAAAAASSVRNLQAPADLDELVSKSSTKNVEVSRIVMHLAGAIGAASETIQAQILGAITAYDSLVGKLGDHWIGAISQELEYRALLTLVSHLDKIAPLPRDDVEATAHARTIVNLLAHAIDDPAGQVAFWQRSLQFITGAAALEASAIPLILKCIESAVTDTWGFIPLMPVLQRLDEISNADRTAACQIITALFTFNVESDRSVPVYHSEILPMFGTWAQAHQSLRKIVTENFWPAFSATDPLAATSTLRDILTCFTNGNASVPIQFGTKTGEIAESSTYLRFAGGEEVATLLETTVNALVQQAQVHSVEGELDIWIGGIRHAEAWSAILEAAATDASLAAQVQDLLVQSGGFFDHHQTRDPAINLAHSLSPVLNPVNHALLELTVMAVPERATDDTLRGYLERARDNALLALDKSRIQTDLARARVDEIEAARAESHDEAEPDENPLGGGRGFGGRMPVDEWGMPTGMAEAVEHLKDAAEESTSNQDKWSALISGVSAARAPENVSSASQIRYLLGKLVNQLINSEQFEIPAPLTDEWLSDLLLALARGDELAEVPEA